MEKDEDAIRDIFKANAKMPRYDQSKAGKLTMQMGILPVDVKIPPSQEAQDYINKLGQSLIPSSQRALPETDPLKVPFKFFIVEFDEPFVLGLLHGEVAVSTGLFNLLENEAQLASMMSREIAHVVQKHQYWQFNESKQKRMSMVLGRAMSYSHLNQIQADRLSLEYMTAAGYDPREALRAWLLLEHKYPDKSDFLSGAAEHRSYLMLELKNSYANFDYSGTKKNQDEFRKIAELLNTLAQAKDKK
jgi:predicted Zn-dependent protease